MAFQVNFEYNELAKLVARELYDIMVQNGTIAVHSPVDELVDVETLRLRKGKHGRPMAHATFKKHFLDSGLLKAVDPAKTPNKKKVYVLRSDWERLQREVAVKRTR